MKLYLFFRAFLLQPMKNVFKQQVNVLDVQQDMVLILILKIVQFVMQDIIQQEIKIHVVNVQLDLIHQKQDQVVVPNVQLEHIKDQQVNHHVHLVLMVNTHWQEQRHVQLVQQHAVEYA